MGIFVGTKVEERKTACFACWASNLGRLARDVESLVNNCYCPLDTSTRLCSKQLGNPQAAATMLAPASGAGPSRVHSSPVICRASNISPGFPTALSCCNAGVGMVSAASRTGECSTSSQCAFWHQPPKQHMHGWGRTSGYPAARHTPCLPQPRRAWRIVVCACCHLLRPHAPACA